LSHPTFQCKEDMLHQLKLQCATRRRIVKSSGANIWFEKMPFGLIFVFTFNYKTSYFYFHCFLFSKVYAGNNEKKNDKTTWNVFTLYLYKLLKIRKKIMFL